MHATAPGRRATASPPSSSPPPPSPPLPFLGARIFFFGDGTSRDGVGVRAPTAPAYVSDGDGSMATGKGDAVEGWVHAVGLTGERVRFPCRLGIGPPLSHAPQVTQSPTSTVHLSHRNTYTSCRHGDTFRREYGVEKATPLPHFKSDSPIFFNIRASKDAM